MEKLELFVGSSLEGASLFHGLFNNTLLTTEVIY
jgi:hypothetical protein